MDSGWWTGPGAQASLPRRVGKTVVRLRRTWRAMAVTASWTKVWASVGQRPESAFRRLAHAASTHIIDAGCHTTRPQSSGDQLDAEII